MCPPPHQRQLEGDQDFKMSRCHPHLIDHHMQNLGQKKRPKVALLILYLFLEFMKIKQNIANFVCMWLFLTLNIKR